ncbi:MAG: hypothetical protein M3R36_08955 [Bacteroidota bacterium]|nr:hypothetical protein [Bacteroidota bacterium]
MLFKFRVVVIEPVEPFTVLPVVSAKLAVTPNVIVSPFNSASPFVNVKLPSEELKKFGDLVSSPYHNKKSAVTNLYKHIKKYAPEFKSPRLKKEKIWNVIYPGKEFHYGVLKNLIFDLTHLAEKFLSFEYYQRESHSFLYNMIDSINEREIINLFKSKFQILEKYIEGAYKNKNDASEGYYLIMSKMYLLKFGFSNQFDRYSQIGEEFDKHTIFNASFFLYTIFRNSINAINFSRDYIYNKDENIMVSFVKKADSNNLISELIESIKPKSLEIYNILNAYHKYYKSVCDSSSSKKYFDFKEALNLNSKNFSKPDKFILYSGLRNALAKLDSCEMNKSKEILDIVILKIKYEVMLNPDGVVAESEFAACIQSACDMGNPDFIVDFTKRFI